MALTQVKSSVKFITEIQTDWSEMDAYGHINNVMIFKYIQTSRVRFWEMVGIGGNPNSEGIGANLASVNAKFFKPIFYPEKIIIECSVMWIRNSSFALRHRIFSVHSDLLAEGEDVVVLYNYHASNKVMITDALRNKLSVYLTEL